MKAVRSGWRMDNFLENSKRNRKDCRKCPKNERSPRSELSLHDASFDTVATVTMKVPLQPLSLSLLLSLIQSTQWMDGGLEFNHSVSCNYRK